MKTTSLNILKLIRKKKIKEENIRQAQLQLAKQ